MKSGKPDPVQNFAQGQETNVMKGAAMKYAIDIDNAAFLREAERFMVGEAGAHVTERSDHSLTFSGRIAPGGLGTALIVGTAFFDLGTSAALGTQHNTGNTASTTLLAYPSKDGGTEVVIPDGRDALTNLLSVWIEADVLRRGLPNPLIKVQASYSKIEVYTDRIEVYGRRMFWKLKDTIHMRNVASVEAGLDKLRVVADDGRVLEQGGGIGGHAKKAKQIIEERAAVHQSPPLAPIH
jgi:hypothetical protein